MDGTVLIADDDRTIRTVLTQALGRAGCKVHATSSLETLLRWVEEGRGDLVISDVVMPDGNGLQALPVIAAQRPELPVIIISEQNNIMTAIKAIEAEAYDYLPKPFDLPDLMKRVARALTPKTGAGRDAGRGNTPVNDLPLVGKTSEMQALYRLVARVMNTDLPVLISGESGTGKSLVARAIHDFSDRRDMAFVLAGPSDMETVDGPQALLRQARGGSLLFDEIGDFDPQAQARTVRLLDDLGGDAPRILATSQSNLAQMMEQGTFRADLFYRLGGIGVQVPRLRDRVDDIALLTEYFLGRSQKSGQAAHYLSDEALALIRQFPWPGNVRQLENTIRRLMVTAPHAQISQVDVEAVLNSQPTPGPGLDGGSGERLASCVEKHLQRYFDLHGGALPPSGLYSRILREIEQPLIEIALEATAGNQAKCATLLGINRNTLRKKITDMDIRVTRRRKLM